MSILSRTPLIKTDDLDVNNKATFKKQGILNEGATRLLGPITATTYLNVSGDTIFEANVNIKKGLSVNGLVIAGNDSGNSNSGIISDSLFVSGSTTLLGAVTAESSLNVSGDTTLLGAVTAESSLNVSGDTTLLGAVTATSNLNISGNTTIEGYIYGQSLDTILPGETLNIGPINASTINLGNSSGIQTVNIGTNGDGITTINIGGLGDIVNIAGSVNNIITTNLQVTDKLITLNEGSEGTGTARGSGFQIRDDNDDNMSYFIVNNTGTGYIIKPPEDSREVNFEIKNFVDGLLKVSGNTVFGSSIIDTEMTFNTNVTIMSNLNISGNTTLVGATTAVSTIDIIGNTTIKANLNISGNSNFNGPITAISSLNVSGNSILSGPVTMVSALNISGDIIMAGLVTAKSSMTIEGTLYANDLTITSDIKLKNNVKPLTNCLDNVMNLEGVSYYLNGDNKRKIGFIAQNIEKIYPEFVFDNGNNKSVAYPNITAVLVEAIKELKNKYDSLELKYNNLLNNI